MAMEHPAGPQPMTQMSVETGFMGEFPKSNPGPKRAVERTLAGSSEAIHGYTRMQGDRGESLRDGNHRRTCSAPNIDCKAAAGARAVQPTRCFGDCGRFPFGRCP